MNIGKMNKRITIQEYVTSESDNGFETKTWQDVKTVWATVKPLSGKEYFAAQATQSEIHIKFYIRYTSAITSEHRIKFDGKYYEIVSPPININGSNRILEIMCKGVD